MFFSERGEGKLLAMEVKEKIIHTNYKDLLLVWEEFMIGCPLASTMTSLTTSPWSRSSCPIALQTIDTDSCPNLSRTSVKLIDIRNSITICPSSSTDEKIKSFTKFSCFLFCLALMKETPGAGRLPNPVLVTDGLGNRLRLLLGGREMGSEGALCSETRKRNEKIAMESCKLSSSL